MIGQEIKKVLEQLSPSKEPITKLNYDHITLSDEEQEEALRLAREEKHFKIEREAYRDKISKSVDWSRPNARMLLNGLKETKSKLGDPFEITDQNKEVIYKLCLYFSGDEQRLKQIYPDMDLKKGIMLMGPSGVGKTHLMSYFMTNPYSSFIHTTCKIVIERYRAGWKRDDKSTIEYYSGIIPSTHPQPFNQPTMGICFGDLGNEIEANSYGNKTEVMEEILFLRYENYQPKEENDGESMLPFYQTHVTTNLDADMIERKYGTRIRSRMGEMFNVLPLVGESFRK
jgi:ATPase subunit of ABC transporter with duplicated ATPase domains